MFELLGFWSTATLLSLPALAIVAVLIALAVMSLLAASSRGRCNLIKNYEHLSDNKLFMSISCLGVFEVIAMVFLAITDGITPVMFVSGVSEFLAPFTGTVSLIVCCWGLFFLVTRALFDKIYSLEDKINNKVDAPREQETFADHIKDVNVNSISERDAKDIINTLNKILKDRKND